MTVETVIVGVSFITAYVILKWIVKEVNKRIK
jgi:hypothetical protein